MACSHGSSRWPNSQWDCGQWAAPISYRALRKYHCKIYFQGSYIEGCGCALRFATDKPCSFLLNFCLKDEKWTSLDIFIIFFFFCTHTYIYRKSQLSCIMNSIRIKEIPWHSRLIRSWFQKNFIHAFFYLFHTGAHTIGFAQCFTFKSRLFNFDNTGNPDPTLDASLLQSLQQICPNQADSNTNLAPLDSVTTNKFDNVYYRNLVNNSGLLQSDQALMGDNRTAPMVMLYNRLPYLFASAFKTSMVKMSYIGVLTGHDGEIRKNCRVVN